jgi:hypothetical protein
LPSLHPAPQRPCQQDRRKPLLRSGRHPLPEQGAHLLARCPLTVKDLANEKIEIARKAAKKAEDRVYNWMVECGRTAEVRKMIFDAARIGTGVVKGPIPITKRGMMVRKEGGDGVALLIEDKLLPATKWVDPWNLFPDPACGEDIHDGDYILEKDCLSERQVRKLKDQPGYIAARSTRCCWKGPRRSTSTGEGKEGGAKPGDKTEKRKRYPVWYYYGTLKRDEYLALRTPANKPKNAKPDYKAGSELKPDQELVYCICTLINDTWCARSSTRWKAANSPITPSPGRGGRDHGPASGWASRCASPSAW